MSIEITNLQTPIIEPSGTVIDDLILPQYICGQYDFILSKSSWSAETPSTQEINISDITDSTRCVIGPSQTASPAQVQAAALARLRYKCETGKITVTCYGVKPTTYDIPCHVTCISAPIVDSP